ncbi:hypothetical protein EBN03_29850 [Nocardia stercoris]|uniref:Uncharacterized protein n=2 Tax=Nocardia stercoris TaxID=2483361 RepID=A0A3M2KW37_9NOCA|nr:hypothetical protein EBN03_29850 [Nocardia stercoris]
MGLVPTAEANADVPPHLSPFVDLDCRCAGLMFASPGTQKLPPKPTRKVEADGTVTTYQMSETEISATDGAGTTEVVISEVPTAGGMNPRSPQERIDRMQSVLGGTGQVGTFQGYPSVTALGQAASSDDGHPPFAKDMYVYTDDRSISVYVAGDSADDVTVSFDALTATFQIF